MRSSPTLLTLKGAALAGVALLALAQPAAAGEGWYLGLGAGGSQLNDVRYGTNNRAGKI
jgi:hypothetical protein